MRRRAARLLAIAAACAWGLAAAAAGAGSSGERFAPKGAWRAERAWPSG
jgi:hypothetical protein